MSILVFSVIFAVTGVICLKDYFQYGKYPPGPMRFPLIGCLPQFWLNCSELPFTTLSRIWGDVMFLKLGMFKTVVISSHEAAQIFKNEKTENRIVDGIMRDRLMGKNLGVNFSNGMTWKTLRKFMMQSLRDTGVGKASMDMVIREEVNKLISDWKKCGIEGNSQMLFQSMFNTSILGMLWRVLSGHGVELDNPRMKQLAHLIADFHQSTTAGIDISLTFPFLRDWLPETWSRKQRQGKCCKALHEFCRKIFHDAQKEMDKNALTVAEADSNFFNEFMKRATNNNSIEYGKSSRGESYFTEDQFIVSLLDILQNGVDTISAALTFCIMYFIRWPRTQVLIQQEIDEVMKEGSIHTTDDFICGWEKHQKLPYTMSFMFEMLRFSNLLPIVFPHEATEDFSFRDYLIKKGTSLTLNMHALNTSKSVWTDPENFRPERFLSTDGQLDSSKTQLVMAFGIGRRVCPGQLLAEQIIFTYLTTLLQTYSFVACQDRPLPQQMSEIELSIVPKPFYVSVMSRKH